MKIEYKFNEEMKEDFQDMRSNGLDDEIIRHLENRSLAVINPRLSNEWHPTKNFKQGMLFMPHHVYPGSLSMVWWKCQGCGHEWEMKIKDRSFGKKGCPNCSLG